MDQATLLEQEPCVKRRQQISPQVNSEWSLSPWIQSARQQWRNLYMTCGWHLDKPSANSDTKNHHVRVTGQLGRGQQDPGMKCKAAAGDFGFRHQKEMVRKKKNPLQC